MTGMNYFKQGKHGRKKGEKVEKERAYSLLPSQLRSFSSFSSSPTARQSRKEFWFTDSLQSKAEEIIPKKGIKKKLWDFPVVLF